MFVSMKEMLEQANAERYAVMAINCFNLETVRSVITAAQLENAPIIVNIYKDHLLQHCDSAIIAPMVKVLAERATVAVALNLDHGQEVSYVKKAVDDGFSSVMMDASLYPLEENIQVTKSIVEYAHAKNVSVEGEIGCMGASQDGKFTTNIMYTDPKEAKQFVEKTGIDALAVSIGTSHGNYPNGMVPAFDISRLIAIKKETNMPLVLHGGSGSGEENIRRAVEHGINKINVGCDFMNANMAAAKQAWETDATISYFDFVTSIEAKSVDLVRYYINLSGSKGKNKGTEIQEEETC
jgi:fructose-bisphosphate aldolase class II